MAKINFQHILVPQDPAGKEIVDMDIRESLGNIIYRFGQGIACHSLALKIYNSKGELELEEDETELLKNFVEQLCTPAISDGIKSALSSAEQAKETD